MPITLPQPWSAMPITLPHPFLPRDRAEVLVNHKVEQHVSPEIAEARATTLKALEQADAGWHKTIEDRGTCRTGERPRQAW